MEGRLSARFSIPHSYSGMDRMPFDPFCSQGQNEQNVANEIQDGDGEMSAADSNTSLQGKKSGYTFGQNETLLLISLFQKY